MAKQKIIEYENVKYIVNDDDDYTFDNDDPTKDHISYFPELIEDDKKEKLDLEKIIKPRVLTR